jgi:cobalt-zinc-cadmium efflux system outer membrane protein
MTTRILLLLTLLLFPLRAVQAAEPAITLEALVATIIAHHPELAFYEAEIAAARAQTHTASALADPTLSTSLGQKRAYKTSGALAGEGTAWSVSVTQTFDWPGRLALRKTLANGQVSLAELGLARFRAALEARARTLTYGLHASQTRAAAVREVADRFTALKENFLAREPAGLTPLLETRVIEAAELSLQRRATNAELSLHAALLELNQLRGASPETPLMIIAPALIFSEAPATDVLLAAARENNFDYRIRRTELEQQGFAVRLAQNERRPSFSLSPFYSRESADGHDTIIGLGLSLPIPITSRSRATIENAEARQRQAEIAALIAQRDLDNEVLATAHVFATHVAEIRRWSPETAQKFREAASLADRHYRLGAVPIATYVELQSSYLNAIEALLDTQAEALAAGLKLRQLTGLDFNAVTVATAASAP